MKNLIGFRQYLKSEQSYMDLLKLIQESKNALKSGYNDLSLYLAICGDNPDNFLKEKNLARDVEYFNCTRKRLSPTQLVKYFIGDYPNGDPIKIIYYSTFPEGLTYPLDLFTQLAVFLNFDHLGVCDSDFQIPFFEILESLNFHCKNSQSGIPTVTFAKRIRRSLDAKDYPINRWAMEDIENLYVYFLSNIKYLQYKLDIQSGLCFTNRRANVMLDFNKVGKWVGNLHLAISLLRNPSALVLQRNVDTNLQNESSINFQVQCLKIDELYDYYLIPMENIIRIAMDNPRKYLMNDWDEGLSTKEIENILQGIFKAYLEFERQ
jgi:hypothetical protein